MVSCLSGEWVNRFHRFAYAISCYVVGRFVGGVFGFDIRLLSSVSKTSYSLAGTSFSGFGNPFPVFLETVLFVQVENNPYLDAFWFPVGE